MRRSRPVCLQILSDEPIKLDWKVQKDPWRVIMLFFGFVTVAVSLATVTLFVSQL